ncbi:MAG: alanine--tRNA ligase [bacterium]|nr:alanine--tRNA ligase [bacterium]
MNSDVIRKKYLEFFERHGHTILPSASLVPENDPTTLFTGSGMQPMVPYLLGQVHPAGRRLVDSQKCFRSQDIEEVGDSRHTTFFEMLGNWSLGDYFKQEQISWMFSFLTKELGLNPERIFVTVFRGNDTFGIPRDDESVRLWQQAFKTVDIDAKAVDMAEHDGLQDGRIFYYDESKNWWSRAGILQRMPLGEPGGPDTEMFWDFGAQHNLHEQSAWKDQPCHVNCDCGRFMEIGNNVFMEYRKTVEGFEKLSQRNVDFGGGLERMAAAMKDNPDMFQIDLFDGIRGVLETRSGQKYGTDPSLMRSFRIVMDHLRAATFLIGDGAIPSNKDQGYVTRRLLRRAMVQGKKLGIEGFFVADLAQAVIHSYQEAYPLLKDRQDIIIAELNREEEKFAKTLLQGLKKLEEEVQAHPNQLLTGITLFNLMQNFGFPLEVSLEIAQEKGIVLEPKATLLYEELMDTHRNLSRTQSEQKFSGGLADHSDEVVRGHTGTHLLHMALRQVLGPHVVQKGSNITHERLRFDFLHPQKMTPEELQKVEQIVNEQIQKKLPVSFQMVDVDEAKRLGAIGVFEDKYAQLGGKIKVYFVGDDQTGYFSKEICGGPHVANTGEIQSFKILKEEAVSAGIRRIKAKVR